MNVMCIIDEPWRFGYGPNYGDIDEVIEVTTINECEYYKLRRFPDCCYLTSKFIPLSDIDETELVNEKETVNA